MVVVADAARAVALRAVVLRAAIVSLLASVNLHQASVSRVVLPASVTATRRAARQAMAISHVVLQATAAIRAVFPAMATSRAARQATAATRAVFPATAASRVALPVSDRHRAAAISLPAIVNSPSLKTAASGWPFFYPLPQ